MTEAVAASRRLVALVPHPDEDAGAPHPPIATMAALAERARIGFEALFVGGGAREAQLAMAARHGADTVWRASHPGLDVAPPIERLLHACVEALERIGLDRGAPVLVMLPAGNQGEEIAARLAVRFDGVALGRCLELGLEDGSLRVTRAAYGGRARLSLACGRGPCFGTVRHAPRASGQARAGRRGAEQEVVDLDLSAPLPGGPTVRTEETGETMRPLEGARIVVSGGRGMQSEKGFALLAELADGVGAALAASLPAVDAGWAPVSRQVGQSGKYVTPRVYVAVGISGTPQHLVGIGPDARIVAINNDPQAEIFRVADLGVVADWSVLLPPLIARVRGEGARQDGHRSAAGCRA